MRCCFSQRRFTRSFATLCQTQNSISSVTRRPLKSSRWRATGLLWRDFSRKVGGFFKEGGFFVFLFYFGGGSKREINNIVAFLWPVWGHITPMWELTPHSTHT